MADISYNNMERGILMKTQKRTIDASPTKELFIYMLTRDIDVKPAVVELIDNSIDGAKKIRPNKDYSNLYIKLILSKEKFMIEDNCSGIDIETAQKYAFKFGRVTQTNDKASGYYTGIFGIGMKRALFKLGNKFQIISRTKTDYFELKVDVRHWIQEEEWNFQFDRCETDLQNKETGTKIIVEDLNSDILSKFQSELFINSLIDYIQKYRTVEAENGLKIEVNMIEVNYRKEKLLESEYIHPYYKKVKDKQGTITIVAGIAEKGDPGKAGWYIYCNGRLVLYADKTNLTGWGDGNRAYHNSMAEFRGYVYFESKNLLALPWNTTKTGIDASNRLYIIARQSMNEAMAQIFHTIGNIKKLYDVNDMQEIDFVKKATEKELTYKSIALISDADFTMKTPEKVIPKTRISFTEPTAEVDKVKESLGEKTNKAVGEKLFNYYCEMEGI